MTDVTSSTLQTTAAATTTTLIDTVKSETAIAESLASPQILTKASIASLVAGLDAGDVVECYFLQRQSHLHGLAESAIPLVKSVIGLRYRPPVLESIQGRKHPFELTLEYGPMRAGVGLLHESIPIVIEESIEDGSFVSWDNEAKVYYTKSITEVHYQSATFMASLSGAVVGHLLNVACDYPRRRYQPVTVISSGTGSSNNNIVATSASTTGSETINNVLLKSSSDVDFVQAMWQTLADIGVRMQPVMPPRLWRFQLHATSITKVQVGAEVSRSFVAESYKALYHCLEAIATANITDRLPPIIPASPTTPVPSASPSILFTVDNLNQLGSRAPSLNAPTLGPTRRRKRRLDGDALANRTNDMDTSAMSLSEFELPGTDIDSTTSISSSTTIYPNKTSSTISNNTLINSMEGMTLEARSSESNDTIKSKGFLLNSSNTYRESNIDKILQNNTTSINQPPAFYPSLWYNNATNLTFYNLSSLSPSSNNMSSIMPTILPISPTASPVSHSEQAAQAAAQAAQAATQAEQSGNVQAAQAAQQAAQAAQQAAVVTASQEATMAREALLSGDGKGMSNVAATCFQPNNYLKNSNNSFTTNSNNDTLLYLYWDGSFFFQVNLTAPYISVVPIPVILPQIHRVSGYSSGDWIDWSIMGIIVMAGSLGFWLLLQQVFGQTLRVYRPLYRCQRWFFDPLHHHTTIDGILYDDDDEHLYHDTHPSTAATTTLDDSGDDVIPLSMGGRKSLSSPPVSPRSHLIWHMERVHNGSDHSRGGDLELTEVISNGSRRFRDPDLVALPDLSKSSRVALPVSLSNDELTSSHHSR
jgi:hypothetical protein